jgi:hypothetical protein
MTLKFDESHVVSLQREVRCDAGRGHVAGAEPLQIVEHLIARTEYLSGLAISLSRAAAAGDLTEGEVFQQVDIAACEFRRHLDALMTLLRPGGPGAV